MKTIDNSRTQTKETQSTITPKMAIELLQEGNRRFLNQRPLQRKHIEQVEQTAGGQFPFAIVLSCIDARVPAEIVFDQGIGDIFSVRVAGNFVNEDILGSMEYACKFAGTKLVIVMGHTSCGAVKGACDSVKAGNLSQLIDKIKPAVDETKTGPNEKRNSDNLDFVNRVAQRNVELTVENIYQQSPILNELYQEGTIDIVKAMYDVTDGKVAFLK